MTAAPPDTPPQAPFPGAPPSGEQEGMGSTVGRGAVWMMAATVLAKSASFLSQILLGLWLVPEDFAKIAMATAATKLLSICQDAGIRDLLVQRGRDGYPSLSGPTFWFAGTFNLGVGIFVAAMAPFVAMYYDEPVVARMMWVLLLAIPLGTPAAVLSSKLRLDLRFRATSAAMIASALVRQFGQISLAFVGLGAMSFVYPAVGAAIVESAVCWWISRDSPWKRSADLRRWPEIFSATKFLIFGSAANLLLDQGPYLVLQPALRSFGHMAKAQADILQGHVYWAFQMTAQVGVLLSFNMQLVLAPVFQRLKSDAARMRGAVVRSLSGLMLLGAITSIGFGVAMDPLEKLIFQGKWAPATGAVAIYAIFFPFRILYGLTTAIQLGTGRSAAYFYTTLIEGSVFTLSAVFAGHFAKTPTDAAWWTGGSLALIMVCVTLHVLKTLGISRRESLVEMLWPWLLALLAGGVAWAADLYLDLESLIVRDWSTGTLVSTTILDGTGHLSPISRALKSTGWHESSQARLLEAARFLLSSAACALTFALVARAFMPDVLREACRVAPARVRRAFSRLLFLPRDVP